MMSRHFRLTSELIGVIAKRLRHPKINFMCLAVSSINSDNQFRMAKISQFGDIGSISWDLNNSYKLRRLIPTDFTNISKRYIIPSKCIIYPIKMNYLSHQNVLFIPSKCIIS